MTQNNQSISCAELISELDECRAIACFLSDAIGFILVEHSNYTKQHPVPHGAEASLYSLSNKIHQLSIKVQGGIS